ncbi:MAG: DUF3455 domain-containing protein, partial [Beijerinckiaceae bacterium]|nr:DUF3455 domain-containing protein [Beijerinckiaceae bacterium]
LFFLFLIIRRTYMKNPLALKKATSALAAARLLGLVTAGLFTFAAVVSARAGNSPNLPSPLCDSLKVPTGNGIVFHAYAIGVQIYQWNGSAWTFIAPVANLFADPGYHGQVGTHYGGPTWESNSGSKVVGIRVAACAPEPTAIDWLRLSAASTQGPGVFNGVTFIQRVNTAGGKAPLAPGAKLGDLAHVPYTAEYFFSKAKGGGR